MMDRRRADRIPVDMDIKKHLDGDTLDCRACEISTTGIRLERNNDLKTAPFDITDDLVEIELPLVKGCLTTGVQSRRVWIQDNFEAFAFEGATTSQQTILKRVFG